MKTLIILALLIMAGCKEDCPEDNPEINFDVSMSDCFREDGCKTLTEEGEKTENPNNPSNNPILPFCQYSPC